jgi:hypothetical protein
VSHSFAARVPCMTPMQQSNPAPGSLRSAQPQTTRMPCVASSIDKSHESMRATLTPLLQSFCVRHAYRPASVGFFMPAGTLEAPPNRVADPHCRGALSVAMNARLRRRKTSPSLMKRVQSWRWRLHNQTTGRTYTSHRSMTEAEALARDPLAVRIEWLTEWKWVPESTAEEVGSSKAVKRPGAAPNRRPRR